MKQTNKTKEKQNKSKQTNKTKNTKVIYTVVKKKIKSFTHY